MKRFISHTIFPVVLASMLALHGVGAREDIILSLQDAIGEPPEKSESLRNRKRDSFYSVVKSADNPELARLLQQKDIGLTLTEEEEELVKEYQSGGNVSGKNPAMRRIYPPVLNWLETRIKTTSGARYPFMNCTPRASGPFPTALVLDPEIPQQFEAGMEEYNVVVRRIPVEAELPWEEPYRGRYITHSPIGNQLMSHAISVIIPLQETLERANDISMEDWHSVMDYYLKRKDLDAESVFLVATKEFADLAIRLASTYPFIGLLLEEPEQGMFGINFQGNTEDTTKMVAFKETYEQHLKDLKCPTLIFRNRGNPVIPMNDGLIMKPLLELERPLFLSMTDFPFRSLGVKKAEEASEEKSEEEKPDPRFLYDTDSTVKITQRMLYFIQQKGKSPLNLLPEESTEPRSANRANSLINQFEQMSRRLQSLENSGSDDGSGDSGGGDGSSGNSDE
jgi:hypothetical protein